jgi:hypothetical protein
MMGANSGEGGSPYPSTASDNLKRDNPTNVGNWNKSIERKISKKNLKYMLNSLSGRCN